MIVICPILGGIGNQLFQLTALLNSKPGSEMRIDTTLFSKISNANDSTLRDLPLFREIHFKKYYSWSRTTRRLAGLTLRFSHFQRKSGFSSNLFKYLHYITQFFFSQRYKQRVFLFCPSGTGFESIEVPSDTKCLVMLGYFQSYRYQDWEAFSKSDLALKSDSLKRRFETWEPSNPELKPLIVHIRRGDYLVNQHLGVLTPYYYIENIPSAFKKSGCNAIWVFSNDKLAICDFIPLELQSYVRVFPDTGFSDLETLEAMKLGHAYVIANSTFSWWAAYLSDARPENIFIPNPWHARIPDPIQISPQDWVRLDSIFEE